MGSQKLEQGRRPYRKRKRAASELQTRLRITEAAVELHQSVGPARTSVKAIAERAGVQRATVYRHFPTEQALFDACTSHYYARIRCPIPASGRRAPITTSVCASRSRSSTPGIAETEEMLASGIRDIDTRPGGRARVLPRLLRAVRATLMAGRRRARPRSRPRRGRDRPRDQLSHLALARARAATELRQRPSR